MIKNAKMPSYLNNNEDHSSSKSPADHDAVEITLMQIPLETIMKTLANNFRQFLNN